MDVAQAIACRDSINIVRDFHGFRKEIRTRRHRIGFCVSECEAQLVALWSPNFQFEFRALVTLESPLEEGLMIWLETEGMAGCCDAIGQPRRREMAVHFYQFHARYESTDFADGQLFLI